MSYQEVVNEILKRVLNGHSVHSIKSFLDGLNYTINNSKLSNETKLKLIKDTKSLLTKLTESENLSSFNEFIEFGSTLKRTGNQQHLDLLNLVYSTIESDEDGTGGT
jgi:hypothetical protein